MSRYTDGVQLSRVEKNKAAKMVEHYNSPRSDYGDTDYDDWIYLTQVFEENLKLKKKVKLLEKKLVRINAQHVEVSDVSDVTDSDASEEED